MAINAYYHITAAGAGTKDGSTWANAMGEAEWETHLEGVVVAGDVHFVKEGTYTLDSSIDFTTRDATATAPIVIIGVKSETTNEGSAVVYSDWARDAADRPFIDTGAYQFRTGDYTIIRNLSFQGATSPVVTLGTGCVAENCKFDNDVTPTSSRVALGPGNSTRVINCEFVSALAGGASGGAHTKFLFCYFHDIPDTTNGIGISCSTNTGMVVAFCIFDNIKNTAISVSSGGDLLELNNTYYDCATDVSGTTAPGHCAINNVHEGTDTDAYVWTTQTDINFYWNNHGNDARCNDMWDGVDTTTVFKDNPNDSLNGDPVFTTAGSDFSLDTGSPCLDAGMSITLGV